MLAVRSGDRILILQAQQKSGQTVQGALLRQASAALRSGGVGNSRGLSESLHVQAFGESARKERGRVVEKVSGRPYHAGNSRTNSISESLMPVMYMQEEHVWAVSA